MKDHSIWIEAATASIADPQCGVAILIVHDERLDAEHIDRHLKCPNCGAHETVLKQIDKTEQPHRLDAPIKLIDKCFRYVIPITLILSFSYVFFFREVRAFRLPLVISFFTTVDLAGLWALLVAIREISLGMRTKMTAGIIWMALFWGSFGIVVFVGTAIMVRSLVR